MEPLVIALLIAAMFKVVADVRTAWHDVWFGRLVTALRSGSGTFAIGRAPGRARLASAHGAAGSLVVVLVWVHRSSLILLLGAKLTQVSARGRGTPIEPAPYAMAPPRS